jgi:predicted lipid-binding transport protein (Tim44 family)
MLFFVEIILTVSAWKRGWRGWALIPLAIGFFLAFFAGALMGAAGMGDEALGLLIIIDIAIIVSLIVMVIVPRRTAAKTQRPVAGITGASDADKPTLAGDYPVRNVASPPKP